MNLVQIQLFSYQRAEMVFHLNLLDVEESLTALYLAMF